MQIYFLVLISLCVSVFSWGPDEWQPPHAPVYSGSAIETAITTRSPRAWGNVIKKLNNGDAVTVVTIGSSIVGKSHGLFYSLAQNYVYNTHKEIETECLGDGVCIKTGSVTQLMQFINETWPHVNHTLVNVNQPGCNIKYFWEASMCSHGFHAPLFPETGDILLFENHDEAMLGGDTTAIEIEMLYSRLNAQYSQNKEDVLPLIIMNYLWVTNLSDDTMSWDFGLLRKKCKLADWKHRIESSFWEQTVENVLTPIASFYGWSSLSLRNAIWEGLRDRVHEDLNMSECEYASIFLEDNIHPSAAGAQLMGDSLVRLFQGYLSEYSPGNKIAKMPKRPFYPDGRPEYNGKCVNAAQFRTENNEGWNFVTGEMVVDKVLNSTKFSAKPGLLTNITGAQVTVVINTRFPLMSKTQNVKLIVHYLKSYDGMGNATMKCTMCECPETVLTGHTHALVSIDSWTEVSVSQSFHCHIHFVSLQTLHGSKFKLLHFNVLHNNG